MNIYTILFICNKSIEELKYIKYKNKIKIYIVD